MKNSIVIVRNGYPYADGTYFFPMTGAMKRAKELSERHEGSVVYVNSSDHDLRLVQSFKAVNGRIVDMTVRYCGKVVTSDETIPDELWDKFNEKR